MATLRQPARDLPLVGTGSRVLSPAERFPRDFWLTPRTVLTRKTPMSKLQTFCIRHGKCGRSLNPDRLPPALFERPPARPRSFQPTPYHTR